MVTTETEKTPTASGATHSLSGPKLVYLLTALGFTYKGKPIDRNLAYAMLGAQTFSLDRHCREAVVLLERVGSRVFEDQTRVMRCCHQISKNSSGGEDQCMAVKFAVEGMAVSLLTSDTQDEGKFTVNVDAGMGKSNPGCVHVALIKQRLIAWFFAYLILSISSGSGSVASITADGYQQLVNVCASPH